MTADDRRFEVLRAIVSDYVATREPVGSKSLVDRHHLGVSPATIRNDMAVLEDEGYIAQPHTSAGRIPTDKGYRMFVDRLSQVKPLSAGERELLALPRPQPTDGVPLGGRVHRRDEDREVRVAVDPVVPQIVRLLRPHRPEAMTRPRRGRAPQSGCGRRRRVRTSSA